MNTAKEFSCSMFHESLRAFLDDELPVNIRSSFLAHAEVCQLCGSELRSMQDMVRRLRNLEPVTVSPEFDFSMKLRIRREQQSLKNPIYQFTHAMRDNIGRLLVIPAAAVLLSGFVYLYAGSAVDTTPALPSAVVEELTANESVELAAESEEREVERIRYVLEKVTPGDIERGLIQTGLSYPAFTQISF